MRIGQRGLGRGAIVAVAMVAATMTSCTKSAEPGEKDRPQLVAAFIGDSYTAPGDATPSYWQTTTSRMCWQAVPFGVAGSGYTIAGPDGRGPYVTRVDAVAAAMPDVVIVQGSFNDREPDITTIATGILIRSIHERLPGARVFVMGPVTPPLPGAGPQVARISDAVRTGAEANFSIFVDAQHFLGDAALFGPDNIHPTARGQQILGTKLAEAIPRELSSCD
ncbi:MAG: SGNH/GDSL hydrolase family protein [Nocardiaceae bacterium]|nr:SGNH/GDSL hydrolase family protein [Nocardiaceae bacterium]